MEEYVSLSEFCEMFGLDTMSVRRRLGGGILYAGGKGSGVVAKQQNSTRLLTTGSHTGILSAKTLILHATGLFDWWFLTKTKIFILEPLLYFSQF